MSEPRVRQSTADVVRDERTARMALACVSEPGDKGLAELVETAGAEATWHSLWSTERDTRWGRRLPSVRLPEIVAVMRHRQLRFVMPGDSEWPTQLDDLAHVEQDGLRARPLGLWVAGPGHLRDWADRSVAIVGTRTSTRYGDAIATELAADVAAADVAAAGVTVVSGGAYGIDVAAHRGALAVRGRTIGVLASGVDQPYPRGNARVFEEMRSQGLVVSELPPGERPSRPRFISRNRVIAALALGSVMVEARLRSGAKNTLRWAEDLSRVRMAVPGPVTSVFSEGPHHQIRNGATLVTGAPEVLDAIGRAGQDVLPFVSGPTRVVDGLSPDLGEVFEAVPGTGGLTAAEIGARCGRDLREATAALSELEDLGLVMVRAANLWVLRPGAVG